MECDLIINSFMESIENPIGVSFFKFIALMTEPLFLLVISLIISIYLYVKKANLDSYIFAGTALVTAGVIKILKEYFMRSRPLNALVVETTSSMPSGHATFAIVFFGMLMYLFMNKKTKLKWITASIIAVGVIIFSRLYLRVHWFTDVLGGLVLGSIILTIGILIHKKLIAINIKGP